MAARDPQYFYISTSNLMRFVAILLGLVVVYLVRDILVALIFAVIVASALEPAILWLKERKIPRIPAVVLVYLGIILILFFVVYLVFPLLLEEFRDLSLAYPVLQKKLVSGIEGFGFAPISELLSDTPETLLRAPLDYIEKLGSGVFDFAATVFGGIVSFVLIFVFSFYLAAQEGGIEGFLKLITPLAYESYILDLWARSQNKLGRWLRTQLFLGAIVGVLIFLGLTFLGIRQAALFAILAAVFEIIPVVGPILAAIPAVVVSLLASPFLGVVVVAFYILVQQTESHIIVPVVMRKAVGLSPLVVVLALLVGAKIGGIFGLLLAVPLTAILAELINDWDKKKRALIPE